MTRITEFISSFQSLEEYNRYVEGKYTGAANIAATHLSPSQLATYSVTNLYSIYSIRIVPDQLIKVRHGFYYLVIENSSFRDSSKAVLLGALNKKKDSILDQLITILTLDGYLIFFFHFSPDHELTSSIEIGLVIDNIYSSRTNAFISLFNLGEHNKDDEKEDLF